MYVNIDIIIGREIDIDIDIDTNININTAYSSVCTEEAGDRKLNLNNGSPRRSLEFHHYNQECL